jgi:asparagine synthase (glutamine-hydrolysing)
VGDFLLFGFNGDPSATTFADIRAVPPAHVSTWRDGDFETRRYWEPPAGGEKLRVRPEEHVERFRDLFDRAVGDRLRTGRAGTHLSGGMDSTSVAATARHVLGERGGDVDLRAYTVVWTRLIKEEEGRYAQLVAQRLGLPLEQLVAEDFVYHLEAESAWVFPEPGFVPGQSAEYEIGTRVASFARTLLAGLGGDPLFHFELGLPRGVGEWLGLARSILLGLGDGRVPPLGVRPALRRKLLGEPQSVPELPSWIAPGFASRADLQGRLVEAASLPRPSDRDMLTNSKWPAIFAWAHPGAHGRPYRAVFPFFDLRLAEEVWRTPSYPWRLEKRLLREAMRDRLPEAVLRRPKTVLYRLGSRSGGQNPRYRIAIEPEMRRWREQLLSNPLVSDYVDVHVARSLVESPVPHGVQQFEQCVALAYWLGAAFDVPRNPPRRKETRDAANRTAA